MVVTFNRELKGVPIGPWRPAADAEAERLGIDEVRKPHRLMAAELSREWAGLPVGTVIYTVSDWGDWAARASRLYVEVEDEAAHFSNGPYGRSYFGSGCGWGCVKAYKPDGSTPEPDVIWAWGDNGFIYGITGVVSAPVGTKIVAVGGDYINEGRRWCEEVVVE